MSVIPSLSMSYSNTPSLCSQYSVLKPSSQVLATTGTFQSSFDNQNYQVTYMHNPPLRKYKISTDGLQNYIAEAEWRCRNAAAIVHTYFISLLAPKQGGKRIQFEVYVEHMEVALLEMTKIILPQSLFMVVESLKGYQQLMSKYNLITVNQQTIGLNGQGKPVVWINPSLEINHCDQNQDLQAQSDVIVRIVQLISQKSQPVSRKILAKILEFVQKNKENNSIQNSNEESLFRSILNYISQLIKINDIKLPESLMYIVNQHKISKRLNQMNSQKSQRTHSKQKKHSSVSSYAHPPNYSKDKAVKQQQSTKQFYNRQSLALSFHNSGEWLSNSTSKSIRQVKCSFVSSNKSTQSKSKYQYKQNYFDQPLCTSIKNNFNPFKGKGKNQQSRCKSQSNDCIQIINNLKGISTDRTIQKNKENCSKRFSHTDTNLSIPTNNSNLSFSKHSQEENSLLIPDKKERKIHKSSIGPIPSKIIQKTGLNGQECQSQESSPKRRDKKSNPLYNNIKTPLDFDQNFKEIIQIRVEDILKNNQWSKRIDGLLNVERQLNSSITEGPDNNAYLDDIKLQKLDLLDKQLAYSLIPQEEESQFML